MSSNTPYHMLSGYNKGEMATVSERIQVRRCQVYCKDNPEWGTFGVFEDQGLWFVIGNSGGSRILSKEEADRFWEIKPKS